MCRFVLCFLMVGNAPVYDACGMAGGSPTWKSTSLSFVNTQFAKQGDLVHCFNFGLPSLAGVMQLNSIEYKRFTGFQNSPLFANRYSGCWCCGCLCVGCAKGFGEGGM